MKWNIQNQNSSDLLKCLLENRGLKTKQEIENFLNPPNPMALSLNDVDIDEKQVAKAIKRIKKAVTNDEPVVIYGDYDADGICSTAILFETLRDLGAKVKPFIPQREKEGYGLSKDGIDSILADEQNGIKKNKGLIISVDSGIVAVEAVAYVNELGLEVIILDHHEKESQLPEAFAIIHTQALCAGGISFIFSKELLGKEHYQVSSALELATVATVTDLMPLLGANRSIVRFGLAKLNRTKRVGLRALFSVAGVEKIGTYEIGYLLGPRINASGRIESALTALRMLCTNDFNKALEFAQTLNETNRSRQTLTEEMTLHAMTSQEEKIKVSVEERLIFVDHDSYHQGVIGLVAGKLVEKYYLPAIVVARGETVSRASARSIAGFNIIEAIRQADNLLMGAGGHPMAAGFTIATDQIENFKTKILQIAKEQISGDLLQKVLRVDCPLEISKINRRLYSQISDFAPFGMGNPEPTFVSEVVVKEIRTVGQEGKHLKLKLASNDTTFDAIAFNQGLLAGRLKTGQKIEVVFTVDNNVFNGRENLQLKVKDIKLDDTSKDQ